MRDFWRTYHEIFKEEGENPMNITEKKFNTLNATCSGWFATYEEALAHVQRKAASDGEDPFMVLQAVAYAQAKVPEVNVTKLT